MGLTPAQLEERLNGLGGSDAGVVLGLSKWKSKYRLWREKRRLVPLNTQETDAQEWGTILEAPIATHYSTRTGRRLRKMRACVHKQYGWMRCNVDRKILGDPRGPGVLEIKTVNAFAARTWVGGGVPDQYYAQIQHNMAVTGYTWGAFAILIGGQQPVYFDVARDEAFIATLIEQEAEFWAQVQSGEEPAMDGSDATREALAEQFPADTGSSMLLPDQCQSVARELLKAKATRDYLDTEIQQLENELKRELGEASTGVIDGWGQVTWKKNKDSVKREVDWVRFKAEAESVYAAYVKEEVKPGARVFRVTPTNAAPLAKIEIEQTITSVQAFAQAMADTNQRAIDFDL